MTRRLSHHDRFFKAMMEFPHLSSASLKEILPPSLISLLDLSSLVIEKESMIEPSLKAQYADLLFKVPFAPPLSQSLHPSSIPNDRKPSVSHPDTAFIYILMEHASSPDKYLPFRLWKYICGLLDRHMKHKDNIPFPLIVPLIFHSGKKPYSHSTDFFALFGDKAELARQTLSQPFPLRDLASLPDEALSSHTGLRLVESTMKHIWTKGWPDYFEDLLITTINQSPTAQLDFILPALSYILTVKGISDSQWSLHWHSVMGKVKTKEKEIAMRTIEQHFEATGLKKGMQLGVKQGLQQGVKQGLQQGRREEKIELARNLLAEGFSLDKTASLVGISKEELNLLAHSSHNK